MDVSGPPSRENSTHSKGVKTGHIGKETKLLWLPAPKGPLLGTKIFYSRFIQEVSGGSGRGYIRQEVHLDGLVAIAAASLTSSTFYIKGETSRLIASDLSFRQVDK